MNLQYTLNRIKEKKFTAVKLYNTKDQEKTDHPQPSDPQAFNNETWKPESDGNRLLMKKITVTLSTEPASHSESGVKHSQRNRELNSNRTLLRTQSKKGARTPSDKGAPIP